jgi:hypothetical protein
VAIAPLFLLTSIGRWTEGLWIGRAAAFFCASLAGSVFVVLAVAAVHGALVLGMTLGRLLAASAAARSAMLCGLVLVLPFVLRLSTPSAVRGMTGDAWWIWLAPPAWFLGIERSLLGDGRPAFDALATTAVAAFVAAGAITAAAYAHLYRHFDRLLLRPPARSASRVRTIGGRWRAARHGASPVFRAIRAFTLVTFRRSVLHQGIVVALTAAGLGIVLNSLLEAGIDAWLAHGGAPPRQLVQSALWAPFPLIFTMAFAARLAISVPIELRANWVFRVTEVDRARLDQLSAATAAVGMVGVGIPVIFVLPLQWMLIGPAALVTLGTTVLSGWCFVEILMQSWGRVPFTCSYLPGKGFVPQSILIGVFGFTTFSGIGFGLARAAASLHPAALAAGALLLGVTLALRYRRRRCWTFTPLEFEDQLPTDVTTLRLWH